MVEEGLVVRIKGDSSSFQAAAAATSASLARMAQTSQTAAQTISRDFTGISRVLQDLPYGFNGIANNLTQLVPAAGAAGLAFSGLVSAITFSQIGFGNWIRGSKAVNDQLEEQVKKIDEARNALQTYVRTLGDSSQVQILGTQNAQEEIVKLETLYKATQNVNIPLAERKRLVDELQMTYPAYFKNISDEAILAGGAADAYQRLSQKILDSSKARAAQDILVDLQKQLLVVDEQTVASKGQLSTAQAQYTKTINDTYSAIQRTRGGEGAALRGLQDEKSASDKIADSQKHLNALMHQGAQLRERIGRITGTITSIVEADPEALIKSLDKVKEKVEKEAKPFHVKVQFAPLVLPEIAAANYGKAYLATLKELFEQEGEVGSVMIGLPKDGGKAFERTLEGYRKKMKTAGLNPFGFDAMRIDNPEYQKQIDGMIERMETLTGLVSGALQPALESAFSELFKGGNVMETLLEGVGKSVERLIEKLAAAAALSGILTLISGGSVNFGSMFGKLSGLGSLGGGNMASALDPGVTRPLSIGRYVGQSAGRQDMQVVIRGSDIILSTARASRSQNRTA